jgi:hypothetical protein
MIVTEIRDSIESSYAHVDRFEFVKCLLWIVEICKEWGFWCELRPRGDYSFGTATLRHVVMRQRERYSLHG